MKVSIITVCYNSVNTLKATIDSVFNQTYKDIEYIIIDGGSTDGTVGIIKENEKFITRWISEPDKGLYDAMNKAIKYSTGDLVGILNSDDTFYKNNVVEDIVAFHIQNDLMASIGDVVQKTKTGKIKRFYSGKSWNPSKLTWGYMPPHPSIFFNRSLFDKYGFYSINFKIGADFELITRFFLKNKIIWKYSGITTTTMLVGGLSSSGLSSYLTISKEIRKALVLNHIRFSAYKIHFRFVWKIFEYLV